MSWHIEICGTKDDVNAAIDEAMKNTSGMPPVVGSYLKDAVAACAPKDPENYNILVKSSGHRPLEGGGSTETCEVKLVRAKPWR